MTSFVRYFVEVLANVIVMFIVLFEIWKTKPIRLYYQGGEWQLVRGTVHLTKGDVGEYYSQNLFLQLGSNI